MWKYKNPLWPAVESCWWSELLSQEVQNSGDKLSPSSHRLVVDRLRVFDDPRVPQLSIISFIPAHPTQPHQLLQPASAGNPLSLKRPICLWLRLFYSVKRSWCSQDNLKLRPRNHHDHQNYTNANTGHLETKTKSSPIRKNISKLRRDCKSGLETDLKTKTGALH